MPTLIVLHKTGANGQEAAGTNNWIPVGTAGNGTAIQNQDALYTHWSTQFGNPKGNPLDYAPSGGVVDPAFIDDGTLTDASTITSVTVHVVHQNLDGVNTLAVGVGWATLAQECYDQNPIDASSSSLIFQFSGGIEYTRTYLVNPVTGVAWVRRDFLGNPVSGNTNNFYFTAFRAGAAYPDYANYTINAIWLEVVYANPPVSVSVTGAGGGQIGGDGTPGRAQVVTGAGGGQIAGTPIAAFGVGPGPAMELHLNQWGLEAFVVNTDLEEHL